MGGHVRHVLSSSGHIAVIVNPPGPKAWYEAANYASPDPEAWRASGTRHRGSRWQDWTMWSGSRAGECVKPPPMGSGRRQAIADVTGDQVPG